MFASQGRANLFVSQGTPPKHRSPSSGTHPRHLIAKRQARGRLIRAPATALYSPNSPAYLLTRLLAYLFTRSLAHLLTCLLADSLCAKKRPRLGEVRVAESAGEREWTIVIQHGLLPMPIQFFVDQQLLIPRGVGRSRTNHRSIESIVPPIGRRGYTPMYLSANVRHYTLKRPPCLQGYANFSEDANFFWGSAPSTPRTPSLRSSTAGFRPHLEAAEQGVCHGLASTLLCHNYILYSIL